VAHAQATIIKKFRDELVKSATVTLFVGERVFISASADFPPDRGDFQPPALTVSPGQVSTERQNDHARSEKIAVDVTVYQALRDEEELILGGGGEAGIGEIVDAVDALLDDSSEDGGILDSYFRIDKTGESAVRILENEQMGMYLAAKTITFEVEDQQAR